jgi:hypothetical protein
MTATAMFDHLLTMSDDVGTFEHAEYDVPRRAHGYCVDDVARVLVTIAREPDPSQELLRLARTSFRFLTSAQAVDGRVRNRVGGGRRRRDRYSVGDCWGRSLWAFGTAARLAPEWWMRDSGLASFDRGTQQRSPWRRSMTFAALGAIEVLVLDPSHRRARELLVDAVESIGKPADDSGWRWPEARLAYANAALAEVLIAAGDLLHRREVTDNGLAMLAWLLERETVDGHLSPTPTTGAARGDLVPRFDQQPIEVAAMADACHRAAFVTADAQWLRGVDLASRWFAGDNDAGRPMFDPETSGGYDGLHADGPNLNQGAESTLALISTRQHERTLAAARA